MLPNSLIIGSTKIKLDAIGSTNDFTRDLLTKQDEILEGTVVIAENQRAGKGQRGNKWVSEKGKNLTFSIVLYPKFLSPSDQFALAKAIALGIVACLQELLPVNMSAIKVKWPNDIYVGDKKVCGMLIENSVSGSKILHSVVGIGLNVNQKIFNKDLPNPTSMTLISKDSFNVDEILIKLCSYLDREYIQLRNNGPQILNSRYVENLYRLNEFAKYEVNGSSFKAKIIGVDEAGRLILLNENGERLISDFKEVTFG